MKSRKKEKFGFCFFTASRGLYARGLAADGRQREKKESWAGNAMKFELGWELEPLLETGERWPLRTGISQFCEAGQVETDK